MKAPALVRKLLVIRFSALGDVAMTVPVVTALGKAHPDMEITVLSSVAAEAIYKALLPPCSNIRVRGVRVKKDYKGIAGLNRLYAELKKEKYDAVADLHNVLRTQWLSLRFRISGVPVAVIDKGRDEKRKLVKHQTRRQLPTSFERYYRTIRRLGIDFDLRYTADVRACREKGIRLLDRWSTEAENSFRESAEGNIYVGVAPFSQHKGKIYPLEQMEKVIEGLLAEDERIRLLLFGSPAEKDVLDEWQKRHPRTTNCAGRGSLTDDICLMAVMRVMISMDSANMHLASLVGTPVVSIWGATHPLAGFLGWGQKSENTVQLDLPCRPCSIFGNKPCRFGTYACMRQLPPESIVQRVRAVLATDIQ